MVEEGINLDHGFIHGRISSIPARLAAVIAANGGNEFGHKLFGTEDLVQEDLAWRI